MISDLADLAGVSPRTIRYYTEEGLLPQPEVEGKYAYYTKAHLTRLRYIKQLKDSFLPLREIRQLLTGLTDEQVEEQVGSDAPFASNKPDFQGKIAQEGDEAWRGKVAEPGSAMDYITRVLDGQTKARNIRADEERDALMFTTKAPVQRDKPEMTTSFRSVGLEPTRRFSEWNRSGTEPVSEEWQKFQLADGVELLVRMPMERNVQYAVHQLVTLARKIFRS